METLGEHARNVFWMCDSCADLFSNDHFRSISKQNLGACGSDGSSIQSLKDDIIKLSDAVSALSAKVEAKSLKPMAKPGWRDNNQSNLTGNTPKRKRDDDVKATSKLPSIRGTKSASELVKSVPLGEPDDTVWIYLSAFHPSTTEADIVSLTRDSLNLDDNVNPRVVKLVPKGKDLASLSFVTFKVGVSTALKGVALSSNSWPENIYFREFENYEKKRKTSDQHQSAYWRFGGTCSKWLKSSPPECRDKFLNITCGSAEPERTACRLMEAPKPFNPVALAGSCHLSRSGPVVENGGGVFQALISGKLSNDRNNSPPDLFTSFSTTPRIPNRVPVTNPECHERSLQHSCNDVSMPVVQDILPVTPANVFAAQLSEPGRIDLSRMEAPNPFITVEPNLPATFSRPGPVYDFGQGVFQTACAGKYNHVLNTIRTDNLHYRSTITSNATQLPTLHLPGRTKHSILEASKPSFTVVTIQPAFYSRPGPVIGSGEGVFQHVQSGKYNSNVNSPLPDPPPCSSSSIGSQPSPLAEDPTSALQSGSPGELLIYYQNVRGLRTKIDDFFLSALECNYDAVVLTETWLDDRINSAQLFGSLFTVFRNDRNRLNSTKSRGGGVLIAVAKRLNCCIDPTPITTSLEQLWVKIKTASRTVSVGVIYLPPDRKSDLNCIENHVNSIGAVLSRLDNNDLALLLGDYNQSGLIWNTDTNNQLPTVDVLRSSISASCGTLLDGFNLHGLAQVNTVLNRNARLLDLVLANEHALPECSVSEVAEPLISLDADHPALETSISLHAPISFEPTDDVLGLDFRKADFLALSHGLEQVDWQMLEQLPSVDEAVENFIGIVNRLITNCVPLRRPPLRPAWSNARLRHLKRLRSAALRKYCQTRNSLTKRWFSQASNNYRKYNRFLYKRYTRRMQHNLRTNPKQFWSFVNTKRNEVGLPTEISLGDRHARTPFEKCNLLAEHFRHAFNDTTASADQVNEATRDTPNDVFHFDIFEISEELVESAINKMKHSTTAGPDGIPACILKKCSSALTKPLTKLFNLSLQQGEFPRRWKSSFMFPVFKKGEKRKIENYRGITSLCACSKVFEIIINDALFTSCCSYISLDQHGFYPKRSVSTNLAPFVSSCLQNMEAGAQTDVIYTDVKAAFDRVDHAILLAKLDKLGVSQGFIRWFKSYLTNRELCVKIGAAQSNYFTNTSGVPQGSNLGPLLFSIFINEVGLIIPVGCRSFYADDVKIYVVVRSLADCLQLQHMIEDFEDWCSRNFVTLSIQKCSIISFHRKQKPIMFNYTINNEPLQRVTSIRDLGITLDPGITFKLHYSEIIAKANRQLGFIFKIADEFRDPTCLKALYCSLVRSVLEFGDVIWCPYQAIWIARIESVQKKFVRYALRHLPWNDPVNLPPYEHRCQLLSLDTLERRRTIAQAVFVAKVFLGGIDSPGMLGALEMYAPERPLRTRNFLHLGARTANYGLHDPIRFMSASFNRFYDYFDFNISTVAFRNRIQRSLHEG